MAHKCHAASRAFDTAARGVPAPQQRHSRTLWPLCLESSTRLGTVAAWKARMGGEMLLLHTQYVYDCAVVFTCAAAHYSGVLL
jgi:hypothetical protein